MRLLHIVPPLIRGFGNALARPRGFQSHPKIWYHERVCLLGKKQTPLWAFFVHHSCIFACLAKQEEVASFNCQKKNFHQFFSFLLMVFAKYILDSSLKIQDLHWRKQSLSWGRGCWQSHLHSLHSRLQINLLDPNSFTPGSKLTCSRLPINLLPSPN